MPDTKPARAAGGALLHWIARVIFILWALFWLYFNIGSGIVEAAEYGWKSLAGHFAVAAIILIAALIAWFFEGMGGPLLILLALALCYFFVIPAGLSTPNGVFLLLAMVLPALVAGVLLVANQWVVRKPQD